MTPDLRAFARSIGIGLLIGAVAGLVFHQFLGWTLMGGLAGFSYQLQRTRAFKVFVALAMLGMIIVALLIWNVPATRKWIFRAVGEEAEAVPVAPTKCAFDSLTPRVGQLAALSEPQDFGYPTTTVDRLSIRQWLSGRYYDALDTMLTAYSDSARRDFRLEYRAFDVYESFYVSDTTLKPFMDEWVHDRPRSGNARLIRASYYVAAAYDARGAKNMAKTSTRQVSGMRDFQRLARADVDTALTLMPCNVNGYSLLMKIAPLKGDTGMSRALLNQALTMQPQSFVLRARHMYNLRPRWGGSYEAMERFATEADPVVAVNPRLAALHGFEPWDRGDGFERNNDFTNALAQYTLALTSGDLWQFRLERGQFFLRHDRLDEAADDLDHAILQRPQHVDVLRYRAKVSYAAGRATQQDRSPFFSEAFRLIDLAAQLDPGNASVQETLEFYRKNIPEYAPNRP